MPEVHVQTLPGGLKIASGGTRTSIKLDRPWQTRIRIDPSSCPFENKEQKGAIPYPGDWLVLPNEYTPHSWHKLIIPKTCWSEEDLRQLGGKSKIEAAILIVEELISKSAEEYWLGVHIGPGAGQNLGHLHYHLLQPMKSGSQQTVEQVPEFIRRSPCSIFEDDGYRVVPGGPRAGQCFFAPTKRAAPAGTTNAKLLAETVSKIIQLYNMKFLSKQGLSPDFLVAVTYKQGAVLYGSYIPILNNWGFTEYLGLVENTPLLLPWPHEKTLDYLRET